MVFTYGWIWLWGCSAVHSATNWEDRDSSAQRMVCWTKGQAPAPSHSLTCPGQGTDRGFWPPALVPPPPSQPQHHGVTLTIHQHCHKSHCSRGDPLGTAGCQPLVSFPNACRSCQPLKCPGRILFGGKGFQFRFRNVSGCYSTNRNAELPGLFSFLGLVSLRFFPEEEGSPDAKRYFIAWLIFLCHFSSQGVLWQLLPPCFSLLLHGYART